MPLTMHMIHPRVSLLTPVASMVGRSSPRAVSCGNLVEGDQTWCLQ